MPPFLQDNLIFVDFVASPEFRVGFIETTSVSEEGATI